MFVYRNEYVITLATAFGAVLLSSHAGAYGQAITYQGQLKQAGVPFNGTTDLFFLVYSTETGNVGSALGGQIINGVPVNNGLFTVKLNANNELGVNTFASGEPRWLEIRVGGVNGTLLTPRQEMTSAPLARYAAAPWLKNGTNIYYSNGNVGVGKSDPSAKLHLSGAMKIDSNNTLEFGADEFKETNAGKIGYQRFSSGLDIIGAGTEVSNRRITFFNEGGGIFQGNIGLGTNSPVCKIHVVDSSMIPLRIETSNKGGTWMTLKNTSTDGHEWSMISTGQNNGEGSGRLLLRDNTQGQVAMTVEPDGDVGIGTISPTNRLSVAGSADISGSASINGNLNIGTVFNGDTYASVQTVGGNTARAGLKLRHFNTDYGWTIESDERLASYGLNFLRHFADSSGVSAMFIQSNTGNVGIGTTTPDTRLVVKGEAKVDVLQITGGADIAEPFNVKDGTNGIEPGMVVSIDPDRVGELKLSTEAYDRTVAGIISGAGGVRPGMMLRQEDTEADGKHPVALTGRVYCWVDADAGGAVKAGDLLTTSNTPGHAMRVNDHSKAAGAVLGKAMSSLKTGKGLVLVLVSLQ